MKKQIALMISVILIICTLCATFVACNKDPYAEENFVGEYTSYVEGERGVRNALEIYKYIDNPQGGQIEKVSYTSNFIEKAENGGLWHNAVVGYKESGEWIVDRVFDIPQNPFDSAIENEINSIISMMNEGFYHQENGLIIGENHYNYANKTYKPHYGEKGYKYTVENFGDSNDYIEVSFEYLNVDNLDNYSTKMSTIRYFGEMTNINGGNYEFVMEFQFLQQ